MSDQRPQDAGDPTYPDAERCAQTLENCEDDLLTEAAFVRWQGREIDRLRAALVAAMAIVQQDRVSLYECSRHQATGEIEPEDAAAIAELDAIIAQADAALGSEG